MFQLRLYVFRPTRELFSIMENTGEGLQILTYALHTKPLSTEGSLTCHTHSGTCQYLRGPVNPTLKAERGLFLIPTKPKL